MTDFHDSDLGTTSDSSSNDLLAADLHENLNDWLQRDKELIAPYRDRPEVFEEPEQKRLQCSSRSRYAQDRFIDACEAGNGDESQANFVACKEALEDLWSFASMRGRAFQDLLALLQAAVKNADLADFQGHQRDAIRLAFQDLVKWFIDEEDVKKNTKQFAECNVDILGPIRGIQGRSFRVVIEEVK